MCPKSIDQLYWEAAQLASETEQAAFLDRECGGNPELREKVVRLLEVRAEAQEFLERPAVSPLIPISETVSFASGEAVPTAAHNPTPAEPGTLVAGRYKLLEEIGEGGMGSVWMAEQTEPVQRRVALKLIKAGMDSKQVVARFEAERQALALMDHPNIAKVLDGGATAEGRPYFVLELVKGMPITKYCDEKKLGVRERMHLFVDVCRAVQHAHQKGIIHRDLKPSNVLVAPYDGKPVPKVIDFGVAKATGQKLTEATLFTGFGAVVGTPEYMSPEQAELNNQDVDTRSDIYSLGVLLYELLTGTTPLTRKRVKDAALLEVLRVIREEEPPRPSTRLSTTDELPSIAAVRGVEPGRLARLIRGELDWIVMRALEKDRSRRYETATGLAADVQRYLADEPVLACPPSITYRARKFALRNRWLFTTIGVVAASLLLTIAVLGFSYSALAAKQQETEEAKNQVVEALEDKEKALVETERQRQALADSLRASALLSQGHGVSLGRSGDAAAGLLWQARALGMLPPESIEYERLIRTNIGAWSSAMAELRGVIPRDGSVRIQFTPDGSKLIVGEGEKLHVWSVAEQRPSFPPLIHPGELQSVIVLPDGRTLVALSRNDESSTASIDFWDLTNGRSTRESTVLKGVSWVFSSRWPDGHTISPDGKRLITAVVNEKREGELIVWDLASGKRLSTSSGLGMRPFVIRFLADGKTLHITGAPTGMDDRIEARKWDLEGGNWIGEPFGFDRRGGAGFPNGDIPQFSPGFERALTSGGEGKFVVRDLATGEQIGADIPVERANRLAMFSPDGNTVITVGTDGAGRAAWIWDLKDKKPPRILRSTVEIREIVLSPDGKTVLTISPDRTVQQWDVSQGATSQRPIRHRDDVTTAAFNPDGTAFATGCQDGRVQVWSIAGREPLGVPIFHEKRVGYIGFSPDGKHFVTLDAGGFDQRTVRLWTVPEAVGGAAPSRRDVVAVDAERGLVAVRVSTRPGALGNLFEQNAVILDAATGREIVGPMVHDRSIGGAEFSPDGKVLATLMGPKPGASVSSDGAVNFWDAITGKRLGQGPYTRGLDFKNPPAFSPDGRLLATCNLGGQVQVWEVPTGKLATPPDLLHPNAATRDVGDIVYSVAFSPDGKLLATAGWDKRVRLWETGMWRPRGVFQHPASVMCVAFAREGRELITGGGDARARRWDIATGAQIGDVMFEGGAMFAVADQPGGLFQAITNGPAVQLWDRGTGQRVGPAFKHPVDVIQLKFFRDGRSLYNRWSPGAKQVLLPKPAAGDPALLRLQAEVMTGFELMPNGETRPLDMSAWLARSAELHSSDRK